VALAVTKGIDVSLSKLDVAEAYSTTFNNIHPILDIFTKHKFWISTGMFPQIISFRFIKKWIIRIVEFQCIGADNIYYSLNSSIVDVGDMRAMNHNVDGTFSFDLTNEISNELTSINANKRNDSTEDGLEATSSSKSSSSNNSSSTIGGDILIIRVDSGKQEFITLQNLCIKAFQQS
jgi:hypothetical protein